MHLIENHVAFGESSVGDGKIMACASVNELKAAECLWHGTILIGLFPMGEGPAIRKLNQIQAGRSRRHARDETGCDRIVSLKTAVEV